MAPIVSVPNLITCIRLVRGGVLASSALSMVTESSKDERYYDDIVVV